MHLIKICVVLMVLLRSSVSGNIECRPKMFSDGKMACVCNSTYCDTIDPVTKEDAGTFIIYSSSKNGLRFAKKLGKFQNTSCKDYVFEINKSKTYQKLFGFGGAFTDSAGLNLNSLPLQARKNVLRSYFSPEGIEYNFGRVPIGGTDFSTRVYTLDDEDTDVTLNKFNLTYEDYNLKIPYIKLAKELNQRGLNLIGTAWSAPKWMKTNGAFVGGSLKPQYYQLWADYHLKFLDAYKKEGIEFWGITTGNEPINAVVTFLIKFNSMGWRPRQQIKWIGDNLGPTLRNSNFSNTKIIILDDQRFLLPFWVKIVLSDSTTNKYVDGIATHWYWDKIVPASRLTETHNLFPEKFIINTEASQGDKPWEIKVIPGSWERGQYYIDDIIENFNNWMSAWLEWNLALDMNGGPNWANNFVDSPILVDASKGEFYKQPTFYAIGHCSKFIKPGAYRINITLKSCTAEVKARASHSYVIGIKTLAVINEDKSTVIVIHNRNNKEVDVTLHDDVRGNALITLPPLSFNTIIYW